MVQRTPARVHAEQFGYRKSHFFFRLRQKSHAVETRLLRVEAVGVATVESRGDTESDGGGGKCGVDGGGRVNGETGDGWCPP